jgi:pyruvate dehydrogenase E2 component (dihydrolipoamide acetyltransferase)
MAVEIIMPKLSDTMEEGTILKWLKREGDTVARGEVIAEVETDKADMELEAEAAGTLREIKVGAGQSAPVGAVLALLDEDGAAQARERGGQAAAGREGGPRDAADTERKESAPERRPAGARAPATGAPERAAEPAKASPSARHLADEHGIDLASVRGSGPGGRIVKEDVAAAVEAQTRRAEAPRRETAGDGPGRAERPREGAGGEGRAGEPAEAARRARETRAEEPPAPTAERHEMSRMRQSIARRMTEAFREIPHFYVTAEIDMTEAVRLKQALQASELFATPITYTHMVLKATALALRRHPRLNSSYRDGAIEVKGEINLGMAVAVEDGLIVPIVRRADELPLGEIAAQARRLAERASQGRFDRDDLSGGTFTVSNMGMLDIEHFTAVINPPQAAILAVGAIKERPVVRGGVIVPARTMRVTLSCDHRIIDGVMAGRFLEELKRLLESPIVLVVRER